MVEDRRSGWLKKCEWKRQQLASLLGTNVHYVNMVGGYLESQVRFPRPKIPFYPPSILLLLVVTPPPHPHPHPPHPL